MSKYRVLIVEDNPDTRELIKEQLDGEQYELLTAKDGQDAILRVGERAPDVVIMDVMMPHLDGFETARYLKLRYPDRFTPVLMLTAKSDVASREEGARYGCEDYRGKPYTVQQLLSSVESLLELGELENQLLDIEQASSEPAEQDEEGEGEEEAPTVDAAALEESRRRIVDLRIELAKRLIAERSLGIARSHLERVLELSEENEDATRLLGQVDAGVDQ